MPREDTPFETGLQCFIFSGLSFQHAFVENRILIQPVLWASVLLHIPMTTDERAQSNRVCYFPFDLGDPEESSLYKILFC